MSLQLVRKGGPFKIIFIPYAGGNAASFSHVVRHLSPHFTAYAMGSSSFVAEDENPPDGYAEAFERLTEELHPVLNGTYALFGYSLGGLFVHDLLHHTKKAGLTMPRFSVIAATMPPHLMHKSIRKKAWFEMEDHEITENLVRYYGLPPSLAEDGDFLTAFLPIFKSDSRIFHTYPAAGIRVTEVPTLVFSGSDDEGISVRDAQQWAMLGKATDIRIVPGGHMFLSAQGGVMAQAIEAMRRRSELGEGRIFPGDFTPSESPSVGIGNRRQPV